MRILKDDQRFVYFKQGEDGYDGTYLYNIETGMSSLITLEDLLNTGGVFPTNDGQLAFMTGERTEGVYQGVVFDPLTLQSQKFEMYKRDWANKDIFNNEFSKFMGAFEKDGGYIFLFTVQNLTLSRQQWTFENLSYNTKTNKLTEVAGYEDTMSVNMCISPSGEYIAVSHYNQLDVVRSDSLLP